MRHGQTDWNLEHRIQGSTDIPLNETGLAQATHTRDALANAHFDAVASSHLQRASVTATTIAGDRTLPIVVDRRLTERSFAHVEGWKVADVKAAFPSFDDIAGVEPWSAVTARMLEGLLALADAYEGGRVLVVTHGSAIRAFVASVQGIGPRDVQSLWNCSISQVRHERGTWVLDAFNDNSHLPDQLRS